MSKTLIYQPGFVSSAERAECLKYFASLHPIWEQRYSDSNPSPEGTENRILLRPVYWLGNWQFACLNYYHPPKGIDHRCVEAEPFPPVLRSLVSRIERMVQDEFDRRDIPHQWTLNTCLINFYGDRILNGQKIDAARVGEHRDFEPGPVASLSFGEKAFFQFVRSRSKQSRSEPVLNQWLEDSALQIFGGRKLKSELFHRVQRVENRRNETLGPKIEGFLTRRINLTFRYVPREHILPLGRFPENLQKDVWPYISELSQYSSFFKNLHDSLGPKFSPLSSPSSKT